MKAEVPAVVLLSGGLDSATVLALARAAGRRCLALSFRYGQRHAAEIAAATRVARSLGAASHRVVTLDWPQPSGSALTDPAVAVPRPAEAPPPAPARGGGPCALPPATYVPARNTVFLALALSYAEASGAAEIHWGVNAVDSSGYPDCRPEFVAAFQALADVATAGGGIRVVAPLLEWSKARIAREGTALGVDFGETVSCYDPASDGRACGTCEACLLRRRGFEEAGLPDPTRYV